MVCATIASSEGSQVLVLRDKGSRDDNEAFYHKLHAEYLEPRVVGIALFAHELIERISDSRLAAIDAKVIDMVNAGEHGFNEAIEPSAEVSINAYM